jgi:putative ABC transport system permease protein
MKALRKDFFMQIKRTFNRFISILLIVALGVSFYAGIRSTEPDMRLSADAFYDANKMMDIRIVSTLGLTDYDVEAIGGVEGVECAVGTYTEDVIMHREDNEASVKIMAETENINLVTVKEGRMPENDNECIVDTQLLEGVYQIGDKVTFDTDSVNDGEYTIVGSFISPLYISRDKGTTNVGNGKLSGVVVLQEQAFKLDCYTDIFISVKGAKELISASDEYEDLVDEVSQRIKDEVQEDCIKVRFDSLVEDANDEIAKGQETLDEKQQEYDDGLKEVEDGEKKIAKNEKKLKDAETEIEENESTLAQAKEPVGRE